jgi:hypothetical protein
VRQFGGRFQVRLLFTYGCVNEREKRSGRRNASFFKEKLAVEYFVESKQKTRCFICKQSVSAKKDYTLKGTVVPNTLQSIMEGHFRSDELQHSRIQLSRQLPCLFNRTAQADNSIKVCYLIAEKLQNVEIHLLNDNM